MTDKEAIKYLEQLYPNGGHCWLDEQRMEAIGMAIKALRKQEEPIRKVWHDSSEEPTDKSQCLVIDKRGSKDIVTYSNQFFYKGHVIAEPCKLYRLTEIEMWAYIEDLIPTDIEL